MQRTTTGPVSGGIKAADGRPLPAPERRARRPSDLGWANWKTVLGRTARELISDRISLVAAGCAFYATLALFPAITMLIFIYGMAFDPVTVEPQLQQLRDLLPPSAFALISERVHQLVSQHGGTLTIGLVVSTLVTLWSSATGIKSILSALNMAYEETETRGFFSFQLTAFAMTLCALVGSALTIAVLVAVPVVISVLGLSAYTARLVQVIGFVILMGFVLLALVLLYRFGPSRHPNRRHWTMPGAVTAALLWVITSALFSLYVGRLASYDATYGPLGAAVGVMMWFWVTVYVVLLGAELNAEIELQTCPERAAHAVRG